MPQHQQLADLDSELQHDVLVRAARQAIKRLKDAYGASIIGFGRKERGGKLTDEWCLKFHVPRKVGARSKLHEQIPPSLSLAVQVRRRRLRVRIPTDVLIDHGRGGKLRPNAEFIYNGLLPGDRGSAGAVVSDTDGTTYLLTAGHVAARTRSATDAVAGESVFDASGGPIGTLVYSPNVVTTGLDVALVSLVTSGIPAALRRIAGRAVTQTCVESAVGRVAPNNHRMLSWAKSRVTCFAGWTLDLAVPNGFAAGPVVFPKLIEFACAATGGDSGALVVDSQGCAVGLHIMGVEGRSISYCLPIEHVLKKSWPGHELRLVH